MAAGTRLEEMAMAFEKRALRVFMFSVLLCVTATMPERAGASEVLAHIHGMGFSADGARLLLGGHRGTAAFAGGRWFDVDGPAHDHAGFAATRDALYSSGHPAPGSGLPDPLGLIKSVDGGRTWHQVGRQLDADFHTLAAGYATNTLYVANRAPNLRMRRTGLHRTSDDGANWHRAGIRGLGGPLHQLAVHPDDPMQIAAATDSGLYLSRDGGDSFDRMGDPAHVLAVSFDVDGTHLWFSSYSADTPALTRLGLGEGAAAEQVPLPALADDAVAFIALNPAQRGQVAIATFKRSVYLSPDQGRTWTALARDGSRQR